MLVLLLPRLCKCYNDLFHCTVACPSPIYIQSKPHSLISFGEDSLNSRSFKSSLLSSFNTYQWSIFWCRSVYRQVAHSVVLVAMRSIQNVTIYEFRRSPNQYRGTHKLRILNRNVTITSARKLPSNNESLIRYNHCTLVRSICGIIDERTVILTEAKFVLCHQRATLTYHPDEDQIQYNTIQYSQIQSNTIKNNTIPIQIH